MKEMEVMREMKKTQKRSEDAGRDLTAAGHLENLRELRKKRNISQQRLAVELGISQQAVHKYETGKAEPDIYTLKQLADYFHVSVDYLIGYTNAPQSYRYRGASPEDAPAGTILTLSPSEYHVLSQYQRLNLQTQASVLQILDAILSGNAAQS